MKTLLVLRHGKSSWTDRELADHDRPLKGRGERNATRIGREIRRRRVAPDLVISSTARRARATAGLAAEACGYDNPIEETRELYLTGAGHQLEVVAARAGQADRVLIVGHNPTVEDLVERLTGEEVRMTTANLACVDLEIDSWAQLPTAAGELRFLLRPRELPPS